MNKSMKAVYLNTSGDETIHLPVTLEVEGYGCGVIEMSGKINSTKEDLFYAVTFVKNL